VTGTRLVKKVLVSLMVVGGLSCFTISGAFGLLSAETQNSRGQISSGTLTFGNQVSTGTLCTTNGGPASPGNINTACDALFSNATLMYPGTPATVHVTIANTGSLDGKSLSVYMPSCTAVTSPGAPAGGGNPCGLGGAQIYIQEANASWVPQGCVYPTTGGACAYTADTLAYLASVTNTAASAYPLGSGPAAGTSRYFIVGMQLPATAAQNLQGEEALFNLTWHMTS
jgi:hypothetical protein